MKSPFGLILLISSVVSCAQAASVFWSFQTLADGTGSFSNAVTGTEGFASTPTLSYLGGSGGASVGGGGGGATFSYSGTTYVGSGGNATPGHSLLWGTSENTSTLNGGSFTLGLNTTGLTDLVMRFDIRAATGNTALGRPPASFTGIEYSLNGSDWFSTGVASPTWANGSGTPFSSQTIDLSAVSAIEGQSNVLLRFTLGGATTPTSNVTQNIRIDNLLLTAVPEPSAAALALAGVLGLGLRRRR